MSKKLTSAFPAALFGELQKSVRKHPRLVISGAGNAAAKTVLLTQIADPARLTVWVAAGPAEARQTAQNLAALQTAPVTVFVGANSNESARTRTLRLLGESTALAAGNGILVTTYADAQTPLPDLARLARGALQLKTGEPISRAHFFNDLIERGYRVAESADSLTPGQYFARGGQVHIFPPTAASPAVLDFDGDVLESISTRGVGPTPRVENLTLLPIDDAYETASLIQNLPKDTLIMLDEIILDDENHSHAELPPVNTWLAQNPAVRAITFTSFPEEDEKFVHQRFLSVLKYVTPDDLLNDLRTKKAHGWRVILATKEATELRTILLDQNFLFENEIEELKEGGTLLAELAPDAHVPEAFQNPALKIALLTDREIFGFQRSHKKATEQQVYLDFIASLKSGDYVVHLDHGIGIFRGINGQTVAEVTREYLQLDYAAGDKLFVPIDQAEKVNRFIGTGDSPPRLTRLGSAEWLTVQKRVAAETEKIAKELLALYAARAAATGYKYASDGEKMAAFEAGFPYEETPGQLRAIADVKADMEAPQPMDRLVCGDVGFGKTEVAMRAAFKAALSGKQVAFISPITILTDQHYESLKKRLEGFDISCEMLSRFKTASEQRKILAGLADGSVQIVVGTHRLLQPDIAFKDLGLVIIDEEQRFGVQQKEKLKSLRSSVDVLTMTATPIPRTLNMALNKLRDITTITTPPPGRLPIVTEVRHFSWRLIAESIRAEIARGGQTYFLHNRVATIEGVADRLRELVPEARFVVTHGQLKPDDLEERILDFKHGKFDVLVSSAIIENGIDLPNANTLIVNNAEMFGLSQLYQLRGRVGRSRTQAYSYFLYQSKTLKTDAKKRLRAIVEASELGSGFEIAMKDLEIRGAGDLLGASQSGAINTVGVSHFVRMLNQAVADLKEGREVGGGVAAAAETKADVSLEIPVSAFIPATYISDVKAKIRAYQRLSAAENVATLSELRTELNEEFGRMPLEVLSLFKVLRLKLACRRANVTAVKVSATGAHTREATLALGAKVKPAHIMSALAVNPAWAITGDRLKIDAAKLGMDWLAGLQTTVEALTTEFRGDKV